MEGFEKSKFKCVALEVEGTNLWVIPQQLAERSEVFENLFFGEFREKNQDVIQMEGKKLRTFVPFLKCLSAVPAVGLVKELWREVELVLDGCMEPGR